MPDKFHEKTFEDHTLLKLTIFRSYAQNWLSTLLTRKNNGRNFPNVHIYDFFSGSGTDRDGCSGSPIIILQELKKYIEGRSNVWNSDANNENDS
jgi:three-Cys-motif partner protein